MKPDLLDPIIEVTPPVPARRLSNDLKELLEKARGRSLSLGELEDILQGRGFALFILLLALPFSFPIAVPGLSIPFGIVILFVGMRIAMGRKPDLPQFILRRQIKYSVLEKIIRFGLKLCSKMEKVVRPRMHFLQRWPGMLNLIGAAIASSGLLLSLPLPPFIPFTNAIPAIAIIFLTAGMIERDGLLVLLGHFVNIAAWVYFIFVAILAEDGIRYLMHLFGAK